MLRSHYSHESISWSSHTNHASPLTDLWYWTCREKQSWRGYETLTTVRPLISNYPPRRSIDLEQQNCFLAQLNIFKGKLEADFFDFIQMMARLLLLYKESLIPIYRLCNLNTFGMFIFGSMSKKWEFMLEDMLSLHENIGMLQMYLKIILILS